MERYIEANSLLEQVVMIVKVEQEKGCDDG